MRSAPLGIGSLFALIIWIEPPEVPSALVIPAVADGKFSIGSFAATEIVPVATPGDPVMYGAEPLLPADVTTDVPSLTALSLAIAPISCVPPYGEPRDMLITSTLSAVFPS